MTDSRAQTFIDALRALEDDANPDPLVGLHHADAEVVTATSGGGLSGPDGARQLWTQDGSLFEKVTSDFSGVYCDGDVVVLEWRRTGTGRDGDAVDYDGASVVTFRGDQIIRFKAYYDPERLGRQAL